MALQQTLALSRARRVAGMGLAEIGCRTRQASAKWIDRLQPRVGEPSEVLRRQAPSIADPDAALQALRHDLPRRFFAGISPEVIAMIREQFPEARRELLSQADLLVDGHFDLLGYQHLSFGHPIDWHLDPVHGRRAPRVHWSSIDPLDSALVGDSKVVWELSRHQWTMQLAQAFALTGEERYAAAAIAAMNDWIDANPLGIGINWSSSLEVALRLMAWTWTLALLRHSAALTGGTLIRVLSSIHSHATHVEKYLSRYFSPNTHLTGEALGLFYAGVAFPEFRDAERWRATGATTLIEQADQQVSVDGIYFEQSTCYQRYTCDIYLHFLQLASRNHMDVPARTREHLQRMVDVLVTLRGPDGMVPAIGDADGGQLMPLVVRERGDCRGIYAAAAALFGRRDFAHAAGGPAPEVGWLLGAEGADVFAQAATGRPATEASRIFVAGGYAVMRSGGRDAHQMIVDVGPLGSFGHGHADLLSVQCSVFGHACLVDAGTYAYTAEPEWRSYFRGTAAHNTVRIDGKDQAEPDGPFGWRQRPRTTVRAWQSTSEFDLVDAEHTAFVGQGIPVVHRRRVVFVKPHYWVVVDDLLGDGTHSAEWSFQFAPVPVSLASGGDAARADLPGGEALWVVPLSMTAVRASVHIGEVAPIRGWVSPDYGRRVPAPMLVYSATGPLPMRQLTVLVPQRRQSASPPSVDPILDSSRRLVGVRVTSARLTVHFDPQVVIARD